MEIKHNHKSYLKVDESITNLQKKMIIEAL